MVTVGENDMKQMPICPGSEDGRCHVSKETVQLMAKQIGQMHTVIFGAEGQGGLFRRVEKIEQEQSNYAKVIGWLMGLTGLLTFLATKLWDKILK